MASDGEAQKPDFAQGIPVSALDEHGLLEGRVGNDEVVLVRSGAEVFAIGAHCTHYHGPLAKGLVTGGIIRCPLHHAQFDLRTGEAVRAPALDALACWRVERRGDRVVVRERVQPSPPPPLAAPPESVVIVGGGAAGLAAADFLRRRGYAGPIVMLSADDAAPCDRPNLSKDYLAGEAQEDWIPLRPPEYYAEQKIDLRLETPVTAIHPRDRVVETSSGERLSYGALILATGADPIRLDVPGAGTARVHYLRSFADSRRLIAAIREGMRAVVVGASFIGLEVAASLRTRGASVDVIAPDAQPLAKVLGPEIGGFVRRLHEAHGVRFHLGETVARIDEGEVVSSAGRSLPADVVVAGIGVSPNVALAERAGLAVDRGILVNEYLGTAAPGVFAAGDAARWLDRRSGARLRVEHWVVAERMGQTAAANILGERRPFEDVPFFWSQHYDVQIRYSGHAERWDTIEIDGQLDAQDCRATYKGGGRVLAVATIGRDRENLQAEVRLEGRPR